MSIDARYVPRTCPACGTTIANAGAFANHTRACYGAGKPDAPAQSADAVLIEDGQRTPLQVVHLYNAVIVCPNCNREQGAAVERGVTDIWPIFAHVCIDCGYMITESEWEEVEDACADC